MKQNNIYRGMEVMPSDMDIETYMLQNQNKLFLLVTSSCLPEKKKGSYRMMLSYKGKPKLLTKDLNDVCNSNECILLGILDTVGSLAAPNFEIVVINCIGTGMYRYAQNKKVANNELIQKIFDRLEEKKCFISELIFKSKANEIKAIINSTYPLSKNKKNPNSLKGLNIRDYTQETIQNTRKEVYSKIAKKMINMRFTYDTIATILEVSPNDIDKIVKYKS